MIGREAVERGLAELGRELGLPLSLSEAGVCTILVDGGLECSLEVPEGGELAHLYCPLVAAPAGGGRTAFLEDVLALNLYGLGTGGASLALDRATDRVVLCWSQPAAELLPEDLAVLVAGFIGRALDLKARLEPAGRSEVVAAVGEVEEALLRLDDLRGAGWMRG